MNSQNYFHDKVFAEARPLLRHEANARCRCRLCSRIIQTVEFAYQAVGVCGNCVGILTELHELEHGGYATRHDWPPRAETKRQHDEAIADRRKARAERAAKRKIADAARHADRVGQEIT